MVPRTFPSTYETANGETRMVVFFLSSVSGLTKWVDYISVRFTALETQVNNSYNNNGVILVDPISSTTNRQAWIDYVPVFVDENDTAAWRVDANGFIPVGFAVKPTLNLDFAGTKTLDSRITFTRASSATYFDANGVLQTAGSGVARFDHNPTTLQSLGLLIEEQRTNSIRNNTMQGAVAGVIGSGGSLPTNWFTFTSLTGLTREVVAVGTENGINYVDFRLSGTPGGTLPGSLTLFLESLGNIVAAPSQVWTSSVYVKLAGGGLTNISSVNIGLQARTAAGGFLAQYTGSATPTGTLTRASFTGPAMPASTERAEPIMTINFTAGVASDITLRIGLPQLELGAFATSVIPTTGSAATRNADVATMTGTNFSSWYRADEGTLFVNFAQIDVLNQKIAASITDGTTSNRILIETRASAAGSKFRVVTGGTTQAEINTTLAFTAGQSLFTASTYKVNDFATCVNGGSVGTDTLGTIPVVSDLVIGQSNSTYIRKLAFYPTRLSNAQLQALTR